MSEGDAGAGPRAAAARAVSAVIDEGRSLDTALASVSAESADADRALVQALAYGVVREHRRLSALIAPRLKRAPQPRLHALLLVGVYQLEAMRVPAHAAVHATVEAAGVLGFKKARGLVNAVLRGHLRNPARDVVADEPGVAFSHPDWLVTALGRDWPTAWRDVLTANNERAPMHLRVNRRKHTRAGYLATLATAGIHATPIAQTDTGITLAEPVAAQALPGFDAGSVTIQDGAAQLAAGLLAPRDGERVLDACAAPGNKSAHLLETAAIDLIAVEADAERAGILEQTLRRLGLHADVRVADALAPAAGWHGRSFDRILLDAPCSATGVIRRHPDIKWLRRADDIDAAAARQGALLDALWPALAPGGRLVYATCSILRAEGVDVVAAFLERQPHARERPITADWGEAETIGRRLAPGAHGFDGFYYAVLERVADSTA